MFFRFNFATACTGVGFRLGGKDGYGHSNNVRVEHYMFIPTRPCISQGLSLRHVNSKKSLSCTESEHIAPE